MRNLLLEYQQMYNMNKMQLRMENDGKYRFAKYFTSNEMIEIQ